ncbi:MAG TPA: hypothetical protein QGF35_00800 [Dehalococcoidia bacterium]|nr:hypothetical protein [Dehalococcoidia bacterium]
MANFASPRPVESTKSGKFLHDKSERPGLSCTPRSQLVQRFLPLLVGIALAIALEAVVFQVRAGWGNHREWVVALSTPLYAVAGIAVAHVAFRRDWNALSPALVLLGGVAFLTAWGVWIDADDGDGGLRDGVAIVSGILIALAVLASLVALVWVEWQRPAKPPASEV